MCVCVCVCVCVCSDERSSWAEVYMEGERRYVCLHIPSCSVDQPKMCEKHCPFKLSYIIVIETSESPATHFNSQKL